MQHTTYSIKGLPRVTWDDIINILDWLCNNEEAAINDGKFDETYMHADHVSIYHEDRNFADEKVIEKLENSPSVFQAFILDEVNKVPLPAGQKMGYIKETLNIQKMASEKMGCESKTYCTIYSGLITNAMSHGKHNDVVDVFILNLIGETRVLVYEDDKIYKYEFKEGDMIYIPAGMYHSVISKSPRAVLSVACVPDFSVATEYPERFIPLGQEYKRKNK